MWARRRCGAYGLPAGVCEAARRFGSLPLAELTAPAVEMARAGVALNASQAYVLDLLELILTRLRSARRCSRSGGALAREGDVVRSPSWPTRSSCWPARAPSPSIAGRWRRR